MTTEPQPATFAVPAADLRTVFDVAVGSLNFTSGFLDHEEVDALRRLAVLIGVDPMEATPYNLAASYPHSFERHTSGHLACPHCGKPEGHPAHS